MRNFYVLFFVFLLAANSHAQIIDFSNTALKNVLVNEQCVFEAGGGLSIGDVDTDNDGEIEVSEALAVVRLSVYLKNLSSLEGLEHFTNLKFVNCSSNQLTSLAPIEGISSLEEVACSFNDIIAVDASQWVNLHSFYGNNNPFYSLDLSATKVVYFDLDYCTNLHYLNLKNGCVNVCDVGPDSHCQQWLATGALEYVCIDPEDVFPLYPFHPNPFYGFLSTYCSFSPGGNYNTISGNIHYDCGNENLALANIRLNVSDGTNSGATTTNQNGNFVFYTGLSANLVMTPIIENNYFTFTPPNYSYAFTDFDNTETANFCITPNGVHPDLEIALIATNAARPGFDATYKLICKNRGTETQSGTVNLNFQDAVLDFVSANPAPDAQSTDLLTWNFTNLAPFEIREITITLNVNSPMETPAVNNDDVLQFTASVNSQTDETPSDNTAILAQTVVGSFDPNDKMVAEGAFINPTQLGDYLHYTIRFQNTGTFAAQNVVIMDMLASNLDLGSLQIQSASHPYRAVLDSRKLEFFFENIQLPPVDENEPGSHGYVTFKIKPKNTVTVGNTIENKAEIYFDFNFPIVTNTVTTAVAPLGTKSFEKNLFTVYPNPATTVLNIVSDSKINTIEISNNLGQTVLKSQNPDSIDISGLAAGVYFIKAVAAKGYSTQKFIKL